MNAVTNVEVKLTREGYVVSGRLLPRVSTILGELSNPRLAEWKMSLGKDRANAISQDAAAYGTRLHAALERIHQGEIWEPGDGDGDLEASVHAYRAWFHLHVVDVVAVEQVVYSIALGYAGTMDVGLLLRDNRRMLMDVKSGKSIHPDSHRLQTSAYDLAHEEMGHGRFDGRAIIHLPRNRPGDLQIVEFDQAERDRLTWRCLVQLYRFRRDCAAPRTRKRT